MKTKRFMKNMAWALTLAAACLFTEVKAQNDDPYKEFVSPQWGLKCPEGYIRLTEYKALAETDAVAKKQYDKLMKCIDKSKKKRQKTLKKAFKKEKARFVEAEAKAMKKGAKYFKRAGIEMMDLGAFRLPDGTAVIMDDKHTLIPELAVYHRMFVSKLPVMERDKSVNYDAHNEQTWPIYTNVETVPTDYINCKPEVYRGLNCTYLVVYNYVSFDYHWFHPSSESALVDPETGDRYMVRYLEHFPLDTYLWIHGQQGRVVRRVFVFPPLPENVTTVDYIPGRIPASERLGNASPYKTYLGLEVKKENIKSTGNIIY